MNRTVETRSDASGQSEAASEDSHQLAERAPLPRAARTRAD